SLSELYVRGVDVNWSGFYQDNRQRRVSLPTYPWERSRYWVETKASEKDSNCPEAWHNSNGKGHPLLGARLKNLAHLPNNYYWEVELDQHRLPYLGEHRLRGAAVLPVTVYLEMALAACEEAYGRELHQLRDLKLHNVLFIPENSTQTVQVILNTDVDASASFQVYSCPTSTEPSPPKWTLHATAKIRLE
ncbi:MAG: polyketide synthase dehydratase domain-containing protein, partial [Chroococcidiopsidaceae cyanobacterium CP_BM_RX_35]|nr:polyketide synthase dehydratase domain-containing protein [Chroococcidiopsidaceae cyanobacterium CP_BM_RX_35]